MWFKRQRRPSWQRKQRPRCPSTKKTEEAVANILDSVYTGSMDGLPFALPATNPDCAPSRVLPRGSHMFLAVESAMPTVQ